MRLALRAAAERDLDNVFDYSVTAHGAGAAERYMRDLQAGMTRLLDHPEIGADTGLKAGLRAYGLREHRVYYYVQGDTIFVVRVLHKAMDAGRHLYGGVSGNREMMTPGRVPEWLICPSPYRAKHTAIKIL